MIDRVRDPVIDSDRSKSPCRKAANSAEAEEREQDQRQQEGAVWALPMLTAKACPRECIPTPRNSAKPFVIFCTPC